MGLLDLDLPSQVMTWPMDSTDYPGVDGKPVTLTLDSKTRRRAKSPRWPTLRPMACAPLAAVIDEDTEAYGSVDVGLFEELDLGVVHDMGVSIDFEPFTFWVRASVVREVGTSDVTIPGLGTFNGHVSACFGDKVLCLASELLTLVFQGVTLSDVSDHQLQLPSADRLPRKRGLGLGKVNIPGLFNGTIEGSYVSEPARALGHERHRRSASDLRSLDDHDEHARA